MKKLFVIMPFGTRRVPEKDLSVDFDEVYRELIRPAANNAEWEVLRIDEVTQPGAIPDQYLRELYGADLVLGDISTPNGNVYYELGVRQAISPSGTLLIALRGTTAPFDLQSQRIIYYEPNYSHDHAARATLTKALRSFDPASATNPIRTFLERIGVSSNPTRDDVAFEQEINSRISRARNADQLVAVWQWAKSFQPLPVSALLLLAERLGDHRYYDTVVEVLRVAALTADTDYEVHRQLGFYLQKLGPEYEDPAKKEFLRALELNSADPETLGMLGGLLKRQGQYQEAWQYYETGAKLSPTNLYMQVNRAAMAVLSNPSSPEQGVSIYQELKSQILADPTLVGDSWAALVLGEASFASGNVEEARQYFSSAVQSGARSLDLRSAAGQVQLLGGKGFRFQDADELASWLFARAKEVEQGTIGVRTRRASVASDKEIRPGNLIFHLSDLHFGSFEKNGQRVEAHRFYDGENTRRLSLELIDEFNRHMKDRRIGPDRVLIVVSGDLTYTASKEEFHLVATFLEELCNGIGLNRDRVIVVPGNHDVDWKLAAMDRDKRFDSYLGFVRGFYGSKVFRSLHPLVKWDFRIDSSRPQANEMITLWTDGPTVVVGLNSCVFETEQHHYGFVGRKQLDNIASLLRTSDMGEAVMKIAVLHHHLHPFPEALDSREAKEIYIDVSTVRDAGLVERRLEALGFDIVLHGHKHKPQLRETLVRDRYTESAHQTRPLVVCGAGSAGVGESGLQHNQSNHYEILEVLRSPREAGTDFLRVEWRELAFDPSVDWATTQRWVIRG